LPGFLTAGFLDCESDHLFSFTFAFSFLQSSFLGTGPRFAHFPFFLEGPELEDLDNGLFTVFFFGAKSTFWKPDVICPIVLQGFGLCLGLIQAYYAGATS
jgi:hypothetical protein